MRLNCIFEIILSNNLEGIFQNPSESSVSPISYLKANPDPPSGLKAVSVTPYSVGLGGSLALMGACHRGSKSGRSLSWKERVVANRAGAPSWLTALPFMQVWGSGDSRVSSTWMSYHPRPPASHWPGFSLLAIQGLVASQQCPGWQRTELTKGPRSQSPPQVGRDILTQFTKLLRGLMGWSRYYYSLFADGETEVQRG